MVAGDPPRGVLHETGRGPGPVPPRWSAERSLLSSPHARRSRGVIRRGSPADPDRRRRPQPARHPRRPAARGRLRGAHRPRRRRGAAPAAPVLARPPHHRHADAAHGRPDARARGQGAGRPADHRAVGDRHRATPRPTCWTRSPRTTSPSRTTTRSCGRASRGCCGGSATGCRASAWSSGPTSRSTSTGARRSSTARPCRSRRPSRACCTRSPPTSARRSTTETLLARGWADTEDADPQLRLGHDAAPAPEGGARPQQAASTC